MSQESPQQPAPSVPGAPGASQAVLTPGQLKVLYPYQFAGPGVIYLHFARGWMPVMADMCKEVDELMRGRLDRYSFSWIQFKEKFGIGRFYYQLRLRSDPDGNKKDSPKTAELRRAVLEVKLRAEERTASLCEVCGQPAELIRDQGWLVTLCPEHAAMLRRGERFNCSLADDGSEWRE